MIHSSLQYRASACISSPVGATYDPVNVLSIPVSGILQYAHPGHLSDALDASFNIPFHSHNNLKKCSMQLWLFASFLKCFTKWKYRQLRAISDLRVRVLQRKTKFGPHQRVSPKGSRDLGERVVQQKPQNYPNMIV